jgi:hypothetical protein
MAPPSPDTLGSDGAFSYLWFSGGSFIPLIVSNTNTIMRMTHTKVGIEASFRDVTWLSVCTSLESLQTLRHV